MCNLEYTSVLYLEVYLFKASFAVIHQCSFVFVDELGL